jgi:nucleotide-binding universal stress UspA family protein
MTRAQAGEGQATEACVVVGYDGSDSARRAVARGVRAAGPRGQVILVTVEPKMHDDGIIAEQLVEPGDQPSQLLAEAHAIAARTCAAGASDVRTVAREGNPADEILEVARAADADLIVVGRTGKSFLARAILGSVAVRVVELARCDVLIVA